MVLKTFVLFLLLMLYDADSKSVTSGESFTKWFKTKHHPRSFNHYTPSYTYNDNSWSRRNLDTSLDSFTRPPFSVDVPLDLSSYQKMLDKVERELMIHQPPCTKEVSTTTTPVDLDFKVLGKKLHDLKKTLEINGYSPIYQPDNSMKKLQDIFGSSKRTPHSTPPSTSTDATSTVRTIHVDFNNLDYNDDIENTSDTNAVVPNLTPNVDKSSTEKTTTVKADDIDLYKDHTDLNIGIEATPSTSTTTLKPNNDVTKSASDTARNTHNVISKAVHIAIATNGGPVLNYAKDMISRFAGKHLGI